MMQIQPEMGPIPPCWTIYFTTKNLESTRRLAKEHGGMEMSPIITVPNIGNLLVIKEPEGAVFSVFEWFKEEACC